MGPYQFLDQARRVTLINEDGTPYTGATAGGTAPATVPAGYPQTFTQYADVSVGTSSTQIAPASTAARQVTVTHPGGTNTVFVSYGKAATLNSGQAIYPGGTWTSDPCLGAVFGITSSGTENVTPFY